jgi:peptidoglycan hydrolase CwlO-like protein
VAVGGRQRNSHNGYAYTDENDTTAENDDAEALANEEDRTWEEELAKRGSIKQKPAANSSDTTANAVVRGSSRMVGYSKGTDDTSLNSLRSFSNRTPINKPSFSIPTLSTVRSALRRNISTLADSCDRNERQLKQMESGLAAAQEERAELSGKVKTRQEQLQFLTVCVMNDVHRYLQASYLMCELSLFV